MSENAALLKMKQGSRTLVLVKSYESPMGRHFVFRAKF